MVLHGGDLRRVNQRLAIEPQHQSLAGPRPQIPRRSGCRCTPRHNRRSPLPALAHDGGKAVEQRASAPGRAGRANPWPDPPYRRAAPTTPGVAAISAAASTPWRFDHRPHRHPAGKRAPWPPPHRGCPSLAPQHHRKPGQRGIERRSHLVASPVDAQQQFVGPPPPSTRARHGRRARRAGLGLHCILQIEDHRIRPAASAPWRWRWRDWQASRGWDPAQFDGSRPGQSAPKPPKQAPSAMVVGGPDPDLVGACANGRKEDRVPLSCCANVRGKPLQPDKDLPGRDLVLDVDDGAAAESAAGRVESATLTGRRVPIHGSAALSCISLRRSSLPHGFPPTEHGYSPKVAHAEYNMLPASPRSVNA